MKILNVSVLFCCLWLLVLVSSQRVRVQKTPKTNLLTTKKARIVSRNTKAVERSTTSTVEISTTASLDSQSDDEAESLLRVGPLAKTRPAVRSRQPTEAGTSCGQCTLFASGSDPVELDCYGLALNQQQFSNSYAECQDYLATVKVLYLGANSIGDIQNGVLLQPFTALEELYVSDSDISSLDPDTFQSNGNLRVLDLRGNLLSSLSSDVFEKIPGIQVVRLGGNSLRSFNTQLFANLDALTELDLSNNGLNDTTNLVFSASQSLSVLDLSNNRLRQVTGDVLALPSLKVVNLGFNQLTQAAVEAIKWSSNATLTLLDLSSCSLTSVPKKLPYSVDTLILSFNRITRLDQAQLQSTRTFGAFSLRVDNNNMNTISVDTFQNALNLIALDLSYNMLSAVPRVLPRNLIHLNVNNNYINATFAQLTATAPYLAYLNVASNRIAALRTGVLNTTQVYEIDLSNNLISSIERSTVENMPHLRRLRLRNNPVTRVARGAFGDFPRLADLDLSNCMGRSPQLTNPVFGNLDALRMLNVSNCPTLCNYTITHFESLANRDLDTTLNTARLSSSSRLDKIVDLDLSSCQMRTISAKFLDQVWTGLPQCYYVRLQNNPWHCDVSLWPIIQKMRSMYVKLFNFGEYTCASPPALRGKSLLWLTPNEMLAANPSQAREASLIGLYPVEEYPPDCQCANCDCSQNCKCDPKVPSVRSKPARFRSADSDPAPLQPLPQDDQKYQENADEDQVDDVVVEVDSTELLTETQQGNVETDDEKTERKLVRKYRQTNEDSSAAIQSAPITMCFAAALLALARVL